MTITSFTNQKVKHIRKLEHKKYRQETGLFFVEGLRTVGEAVQTGAAIKALVFAPALLVSKFGRTQLDQSKVQDVSQIEVSKDIFEKIAHKQGSGGIGAVVQQRWQSLNAVQVTRQDLWVALDAVADPGNLGTIMRTADAVGCRGLILLGHSTDPHDPTAVKASMGAIFSQALIQAEWKALRKWLLNNNLTMVGTSDSALLDYQTLDYQRPLVLLMGSERHGLNEDMQAACDHMVQIPMTGRSDSLNLAAATAVMLYEIYNQSRNRKEN
ncbi:MAG: RNA methyltransferase [Chloroflexota bacterium]|nr:RNA methyltransferase [Chloroflexota bacterium]